VILFELLTLEPPFAGATLAEICGSILHEPPKKLRVVRPGMPKGLEDAILKCVEKAPSARFQTVADLAEAITRYGSEAAALSRSQIRRFGPASSSDDDRDLVATRAARAPRPEELAETRAAGASTFAEAKATNTAWGDRDRNKPSSSRSILPWAMVAIVAIGAGGVGAWQLGYLKLSQVGLGRFEKRAAAPAAAPVEPSAAPAAPASATPSANASASASATPPATSAAVRPSWDGHPLPAGARPLPSSAHPVASAKRGKPSPKATSTPTAWEPSTGVPLEQPAPEPKSDDPY
jgi:serine/threonine-protein kinase